MNEKLIEKGYEYAKEYYAEVGVDTETAMKKADAVPVSLNCWQGDDVIGFDGVDSLTGGIATTGNYPGRARTPEELRADLDETVSIIPGALKLNMHASYAEKGGKIVDRNEYTTDLFQNWINWCIDKGMGFDFNPTLFSHPMMDGNFSLSSPKTDVRKFWIDHCKCCRKIAQDAAKQTGMKSVVNYWMPDGYKDIPADTKTPRDRMIVSLDEIFAEKLDENLVVEAVESKVFGIGVESYTVASHEFSLGYAISRKKAYCLDTGHFHPTEVVSAKISAVMEYLDRVLLHISRPVRWDSDHVVIWDEELQHIMDEIIWNGYENRVHIGLDFFDASINRIAAWAIGTRNARKAILSACLAHAEPAVEAEAEGDYTSRLALLEERKTNPLSAVWDYYCMKKGVPVGKEWLDEVKRYEKDVLINR